MLASLTSMPLKSQVPAVGNLPPSSSLAKCSSNRSVGEWGTVFGDPVVATAILDRLLHHSHVVTIRGDRDRLREKRRSGLIKAPPLEQDLAKEA
jgi:hypothetical protein